MAAAASLREKQKGKELRLEAKEDLPPSAVGRGGSGSGLCLKETGQTIAHSFIHFLSLLYPRLPQIYCIAEGDFEPLNRLAPFFLC